MHSYGTLFEFWRKVQQGDINFGIVNLGVAYNKANENRKFQCFEVEIKRNTHQKTKRKSSH